MLWRCGSVRGRGKRGGVRGRVWRRKKNKEEEEEDVE